MTSQSGTSPSDDASSLFSAAEDQDRKLKKDLGFWSLVAAGIGSVIGSGWLFAAMYASKAAGPAALISWVIAGGLMLMIALVFAELGMVRPESGGLVRYPLYSNGRLAASIIGWAIWLAYIGNPPTEAAAVVQYASSWWHGSSWWQDVFSDGKLTILGTVVAVALMGLFVLINFFGVKAFAKSNNIVTVVKIFIPIITIILFIASGFGASSKAGGFSDNISAHGFAPYGISASLGAIASGGLIFAYTGFRNIVELSGEARNPTRDLPRALIVTIGFSIVFYILLQVGFIGALPGSSLAKTAGWHGVNFDSPFSDVAKLLGFTWLSWLLIADSSISPSGSGIVYTAANARNVFGLAKNGLFPRATMKISDKTGVPVVALMLNFVVGAGFIVLLPSWQSLIEVLSALGALAFSIGSVSLMVFRNVELGSGETRLWGMKVMAPLAFMVSSLVIFWQDWGTLWKTAIPLAFGLAWFFITFARGQRDPGDISGGLWLPIYIVFVYAMASIGNFGGAALIPQPWDTIIVSIGSLGAYYWGAQAGTAYLKGHPTLLDMLRRRVGDDTDSSSSLDPEPGAA